MDRDRSAPGDLLGEQGNDRTAGAEHIAEAHRNEFGARVFTRHALNGQFGHALACAHHVGRIDRLVGRDQHEAPGASRTRGTGAVERTQHIRAHGLDLVVLLHQRHMLVSCCMKDH